MTNVIMKNVPPIELAHLLKRRKQTLKNFVIDSGIQSYEGLVRMCDELGVMSPKEPEYMALFPVIVNSPQDGIVVVGEDEFMEEITHDDMTLKVRRKRKKNGDTTE